MGVFNMILVLGGLLAAVFVGNYMTDNSVSRVLFGKGHKKTDIGKYDGFYDRDSGTPLDHLDQEGTDLYYNVATDFYEYGWGQSFHFGYGHTGESRPQSISKLENFIAMRLGLNDGVKVLDMGCGVGGPLRSIVSFSGADVTGVTINQYQVDRANMITSQLSDYMKKRCHYVQGDFTKIPFPDNTFDAVYTIEAMVHKTDRSDAFQEAFRVLKPGGLFLDIDWVMTKTFDPTNPAHQRMKRGIEHGDGLPEMITQQEAEDFLKNSTDFELLDHYDIVEQSREVYGRHNYPWYGPLQSGFSWEGWRQSSFGRAVLDVVCITLETIGIADEGTVQTKRMLDDAAINLVAAGEAEIFTVSDYMLGRKPKN